MKEKVDICVKDPTPGTSHKQLDLAWLDGWGMPKTGLDTRNGMRLRSIRDILAQWSRKEYRKDPIVDLIISEAEDSREDLLYPS